MAAETGPERAKKIENNDMPIGTIHSLELYTMHNQMGEWIQHYIEHGWEMMSPPVFAGRYLPAGYNPHMGEHPHFLVLMRKMK